jgi:hypothetical protein
MKAAKFGLEQSGTHPGAILLMKQREPMILIRAEGGLFRQTWGCRFFRLLG